MAQQNCKRDHELLVGSEEIRGESGESQPAEPTDDAKAQRDFWLLQGDFIYCHEQ